MFRSFLAAKHRKQAAALLPSFLPVLAKLSSIYHSSIHVLTIGMMIRCVYVSSGTQRTWYSAALALEIGQLGFVPTMLARVGEVESIKDSGGNSGSQSERKGGENMVMNVFEGLVNVSMWRFWASTVPCWICCLVPVLTYVYAERWDAALA